MSHYRIKTTYNEEAAYGNTEELTLYAHHNLSCDCVTVYDEKGRRLFSFGDTIDNNLLDAINRIAGGFFKPGTTELCDGVEFLNNEDRKILGL